MGNAKAMSKGLLRSVSRSFYLSMKVLPREMREPVSLGYLLARAADTIADTASVSRETRLELLHLFRQQLTEKGAGKAGFPDRLRKDFAPHQRHAGEKRLLEQLPDCLEWLQQTDRANQHLVIKVLGHITNGQVWDVERFGASDREHPGFVETAEELEQYTYRVAGSVGEFWTEAGYSNCGRHFSQAASSEMRELGRKYGQGLQLVNVLRDLGEDLRNGRCYLPKDELVSCGWDGGGGMPPADTLLEVSGKWRGLCREWIGTGRQYAGYLQSRRVRFATVLPLLIAERTVELLEQAGSGVFEDKVKVPRGELRMIMARALLY
jgi:farnesyl-diphosphate farnesyltransferase